MRKRLLITGAGTSASENLLRSLRADATLEAIGCHSDRFVLKQSSADRRYLLPPVTAPGFASALREVVAAEAVDLVLPTSDADVVALSNLRDELGGRCFLPARDVVELCRDKHDSIAQLRARGVPAPNTLPVDDLDRLDALFGEFGDARALWCRPRVGTCARGGASVRTPAEARRWILIWQEMQGVPAASFTLSEYLPGREVLCQSLWRDGALVLANTFERLSYFGVDNIPSGVTSLSSLAKTVVEPAAVEICRAAIRAVAPGATGAFSIDLKQDGAGRFQVTEINAGRLFMAMTAFDAVLKHRIALTLVRLALGEPVELRDEYDAVADYYMVRDLDMLPGIYHADELLEGITTTRP